MRAFFWKPAGASIDEARAKALVAALEGINIDEAIKSAAVPAAAPVAAAPKAEEKKEEETIEGLSALFG